MVRMKRDSSSQACYYVTTFHLPPCTKHDKLTRLSAPRYMHCDGKVLCTGKWYFNKNLIFSKILFQHVWRITMETLQWPRKILEFLFLKTCKANLEYCIKEKLWHKEECLCIGNFSNMNKPSFWPRSRTLFYNTACQNVFLGLNGLCKNLFYTHCMEYKKSQFVSIILFQK